MSREDLRQIDTHLRDRQEAGLCRSLHALAASELGVDPERAMAVNWERFSVHNPFLALASDARALGLYLAVTGFDLPATRVGQLMGLKKQIVSNAVQRMEDARSAPVMGHHVLRLERLTGVVS